jgi:hypothetical protein
MPDIQSMIGKDVEVFANGMRYTGTLIEVSDTEVHLKGPYQWVTLPTMAVSDIKLKEPSRPSPEQSEEEGEGRPKASEV